MPPMGRWAWSWMVVALLLALAPAVQAPGSDLDGCIETLRRELPSRPRITPEAFDAHVKGLQDLRAAIEAANAAQPEFQQPIWDYVARRADAERAAEGRAIAAQHASALAEIERRHGVDAASVVAVFGVETDYGRVRGRTPVLDATLSRACLNLSSAERKRHFFAALWLLQEGLVERDDFKGSWAGAFGLTQFMPGTFLEAMDDGDGSGRVDIVHSVPDALATTARFLKSLRWRPGLPWGVEVVVPSGLAADSALEADHGCLGDTQARPPCRTAAQWAGAGVRRADGRALDLDPGTVAALLMPAGPQGPAWLVTGNYQALWRYNRADAYALSIALLSDAIRGAAPQRAAWPTDDPGLSRAEMRALQGLLRAAGHCEVTVDGRDGPRTSAAIEAQEIAASRVATGRAGQRALALLSEQTRGAPAAACEAPGAASSAAR